MIFKWMAAAAAETTTSWILEWMAAAEATTSSWILLQRALYCSDHLDAILLNSIAERLYQLNIIV